VNPFRQFWEARPAERARLVKPALYAAALLPLVNMAQGWFRGSFETGSVLVDEVTLRSGNWAIRFLLASLAVTPLRSLTGWNWLATYRRPLGLLAFTYALLHVLIYAVLDFALAFDLMILDIVGAGFIIVGLTAFAAMAPLAVTSTTGWIRRLGKNWTVLHRLAYLALAAGVVHYALQLKQATLQFLVYAVIGVLLLGYRGVNALFPSRKQR
jgi:sulfoxide reductase heme-binding subunit YedZ